MRYLRTAVRKRHKDNWFSQKERTNVREVRERYEAYDIETQEVEGDMIHFSTKMALGDMYKKWVIENHIQDCPASVVHFLQINGLLNEKKTYEFFAVKTSNVIDGRGNSSSIFKEETIMANTETKKPEDLVPAEGQEKTVKPNKEFFLKKWAKGAWSGICKVGKAIKKSPYTHLAMTGVGVAGTLVVEEVVRRKLNKSVEEDIEQEEPIEIEDSGEVYEDMEPTEENDEVTE